ncbi:hypothetical protein [Deinococcus ruber]|uniref:Uncharacterized protein n=1 Tax=Deinococcus ruber TaxID=1848197 RepID=A0A918C4M1_9DEIO|nr:hypothetical protein [Deinococcus ruber]GGR05592.1 hypothetical protein GCM10008957_18170 [Deinococcus ruber]
MTAPDALFDLAINRAATTLAGLGYFGLGQRPGLQQAAAALSEWHARTRFARRVPLEQVLRCLELRPDGREWHWEGGPEGEWRAGRAAFP